MIRFGCILGVCVVVALLAACGPGAGPQPAARPTPRGQTAPPTATLPPDFPVGTPSAGDLSEVKAIADRYVMAVFTRNLSALRALYAPGAEPETWLVVFPHETPDHPADFSQCIGLTPEVTYVGGPPQMRVFYKYPSDCFSVPALTQGNRITSVRMNTVGVGLRQDEAGKWYATGFGQQRS